MYVCICVYIDIYIYFHIIFHRVLLQDIDYSSVCHTAEPYCLFYIQYCVFAIPKL